MPDYRQIEEKHPTMFEGYFRKARGASISSGPYKKSKLRFSDYDAGVNYTYTLNPEHFLTLGLGTYQNTVNWDQNPAFIGKNYNYVAGSLGITSLGVENWRWTGATVLSFQTQNFGIKDSGWISVLFWGEYFVNKNVHIHAGFWGYTGVKNITFLPVIGVDWKRPKGELSLVFPFDVALRYKPTRTFHMEIAGKWFGGPYRFPQRMNHGINGYQNGIFEIFMPTTEFGIYYHPSAHFNLGLASGYTWGGYLQVKNHRNQHGKYYDLNCTPYGAAYGIFKF
jgi:hypothetical protein